MRNRRIVGFLLACGALGLALATAAEFMTPEVTEIPGTGKVLVSLAAEEGGPAFLVRALDGEEQQATRPLPADGLDRYKLALIAQTKKDGAISGYSLVTWKPADKKPAERMWPDLKDIADATAKIRGAQVLMLRQLPPPEGVKDAKWSFELISFRKIEPKEEDDPVVRAKKEVIEDKGARLIEDRRFTLAAPTAPHEAMLYGIPCGRKRG
jgi:hypothetical protein